LKLVEVGTVARAHGVRGELRIRLHWAGSDALDAVKQVWLSRRGLSPEPWAIASMRRVPKAALVRLVGIEDRDEAERLKGATVSIPREALPPLEPGEYYLCDLVGCEVVGPQGRVGRVVEVRVHPSVDAVVVERDEGPAVEQPLSPPWLEEVDVEKKVIVLSSLEGFI
jgi:16S rRNA processing protein RimM